MGSKKEEVGFEGCIKKQVSHQFAVLGEGGKSSMIKSGDAVLFFGVRKRTGDGANRILCGKKGQSERRGSRNKYKGGGGKTMVIFVGKRKPGSGKRGLLR